MTVFWGVDTASDYRTVAQAVHNFAGAPASWVGRYLINYVLTPEERTWLHANGQRILLIANGALAGTVQGDQATGEQQARAAVAAAKALGAPTGVPIALDVEAGWRPSIPFFTGWIHGVHAGGYLPVCYLNAMDGTHVAPWLAAKAAVGVPAYLFSSEPEPASWWGVIRNDWYDFSRDFSTGYPSPLGTAHAGDVLWHQYGELELSGAVDFDVATQQGYDLLWAPQAPPPATGRMKVIKAAGLKPSPKHGGANIAMIPAGGQILVTAQRQRDTGGDMWALCQWRDQTGWLVENNITSL